MPRTRNLIARAIAVSAIALAPASTADYLGPAASPAPEHARPKRAHNTRAIATSGIVQLTVDQDTTGAGVLIGQWDEGATRPTHVDLAHRVHAGDVSWWSEHATHVAGTMIGRGSIEPSARGAATDAHLWSFRWDWDRLELQQAAPFLSASAHAYGVVLGWGGQAEGCAEGATFFGGNAHEDAAFGKYWFSAAQLDAVVHDADLVSIWAVGNERTDMGPSGDAPHYHFPDCTTEHFDTHASESTETFDTLGGSLTAKNIIAVGAVADIELRPVTPELVVPLANSSFGPTDDGRIKPDLVASGEQLYSTSASGDETYSAFGGSSSSSGVVAGAVALLSEQYRALHGTDPRAAEVKALLLHTTAEAGAAPGPDYRMGFGLLDAHAAGALLSRDASSASGRQLLRARLDGPASLKLSSAPIAPGQPVRVTAAWLDPPGAANLHGTDETTPALVNDLNIELVAPDGETRFHPWRLDPSAPDAPARRDGPNTVDTVERIDVDAADNVWDGSWTAHVTATSLAPGRSQLLAVASSSPLQQAGPSTLSHTRTALAHLEPADAPTPIVLHLDHQGSEPIDWSLVRTGNEGWLSLDQTAGTTPSSVTVNLDPQRIETMGLHQALLALESDDPTAPRHIGVTVDLGCEPTCGAQQCGVDPECGRSCGSCSFGESCSAGQCVRWGNACPAVDLGSAQGAAAAIGTTQLRADQHAGSCGGGGNGEVAFAWRAPAPGTYVFSTAGSELHSALYVRSGSCSGQELACSAAPARDGSSAVLDLEEDEPVVVFVDGVSSEGAFNLAIGEDQCPTVELGAALGERVAAGRTEHGFNARSGSCGGSTTPEVTFAWTAPHDARFDISLREATDAATLYALDGPDCGASELACSGHDAGHSITLQLEAGDPVVLVVDAPHDDGFIIDITSDRGFCAQHCDGTPNQGSCYCDSACATRGDCCPDSCDTCGHGCDAERCEPDGCPQGSRCEQGRCLADPCAGVDEGGACDDGDPCTQRDVCIGGACAGRALICDSDESCVEGECRGSTPGGPPASVPRTDASIGVTQDAGAANSESNASSAGCACSAGVGSPRPRSGLGAGLLLLLLFSTALRRVGLRHM